MTRSALLALALALPACASEDLSVTLTPETPEIAAVLQAADARWEAAGVGVDRIVIGPGGAPVRLVPDRAYSKTLVRGRGSEYIGVRWVELNSLDVDMVAHEMGHALGINVVALDVSDHLSGPECDAGPGRPLMCAVVGHVITSEVLEEACSVGECSHFTPEE